MYKAFNVILISLGLFFIFLLFDNTKQVFAQVCAGQLDNRCYTTGYTCIKDPSGDNFFDTCQGWTINDAGNNCTSTYGGCAACVPQDESCSLYNPVWNGLYYEYKNCDITNITDLSGCGSIDEKVCGYGCFDYCTSGTTNCLSCSGGSWPANTCGYTTDGSQTCQHDAPQVCTNSNFTQGCTQYYNACSSNYSCPNSGGYHVGCTTSVTAHAYVDINHDGAQDNGEPNLQGVSMYNSNLSSTQTTGSNGSTTFSPFNHNTQVWVTGTSSNPLNGWYIQNTSVTDGVYLTDSNGGTQLNFAYIPMFTISGRIYLDYNHNNNSDGSTEPNADLAGIQISDGTNTVSTKADGTFSFPHEEINGNHTLTITGGIPAGYQGTQTTEQVTVNGADYTTAELGITPLYTLSGLVYNDFDAGKCYNPTTSGCTDQSVTPNVIHGAGSDTAYSDSQTTVTVVGNGNTITLNQSNGSYNTGQVLESGQYTVTLTTVPTDYHMTYPKNGVPAYFTVNIGTPGQYSACTTNNANDASCDSWGNISNLNFGINNEIEHGGGFCTDVRDENSTTQYIPNNATCGIMSGQYYILGNISCQVQGVAGSSIYFSGTQTPDFGHGTPNATNWIVGGATSESFSPVNPGVIRTSNSYLNTTLTQNDITPTDLSTICTPSNCYLPDNLPSGVYSYAFDTTFVGTQVSGGGTTDGTYTFPTGKNYVFIIGNSAHQSNITFKTKMLVPNGSTATFVTSKDILVDPSVGESSITSTNGDLEGFYSADESFIIQSDYTADNRCTDSGGTKDLRLNIIGSVVVNAAGNGGTLINDRDLCAGDLSCPTYTTGLGDGGDNGNGSTVGTNLGITYILNAPDLIKHKNSFWQELAP